jgi:hypothetical protein
MSTAADVIERPPVTPNSVFRLRQLKAGERFRYYRGNFSSDIMLNESENNFRYAAALRTVRNEAEALRRSGHIALEEVAQPKADATGRPRPSVLFEYYAVGCSTP